MRREFSEGHFLELKLGDITRIAADAIVNAANSRLAGGGGVDGAIHRAGGPSIMRELDGIRTTQGGCSTGSAAATGAGKLPAQYVFHAVGPIYRGGKGGEAELLASCYRTCLMMAEERGLKRITFPSISTGVYAYPVDEAAGIAIRTVAAHLARQDTTVEQAIFVLFDQHTFEVYGKALAVTHTRADPPRSTPGYGAGES